MTAAVVWLGGLSTQAQSTNQQLYGITYFGNQLISVNPTTGAGLLIGPFDTAVSGYGIAVHYGNMYTFNPNTQQIDQIDPLTGTIWRPLSIGVTNLAGEGDLAFRGDGTGFLASALHADGSVANDLYTFNVMTGTSQRVATTSGPIDALAFDTNDTLYALGQDDTNLYTLNTATGVETLVGPLGVSMSSPFAGMTFGANGRLYAAINDQLYTIDKTTGAATAASTLNTNVLDFGFSSVSGLAFWSSINALTLAQQGTNLVIYWPKGAYTLESSTNLAGPYMPTTSQANPSVINPSGPQMFFQLQTNSAGL